MYRLKWFWVISLWVSIRSKTLNYRYSIMSIICSLKSDEMWLCTIEGTEISTSIFSSSVRDIWGREQLCREIDNNPRTNQWDWCHEDPVRKISFNTFDENSRFFIVGWNSLTWMDFSQSIVRLILERIAYSDSDWCSNSVDCRNLDSVLNNEVQIECFSKEIENSKLLNSLSLAGDDAFIAA